MDDIIQKAPAIFFFSHQVLTDFSKVTFKNPLKYLLHVLQMRKLIFKYIKYWDQGLIARKQINGS